MYSWDIWLHELVKQVTLFAPLDSPKGREILESALVPILRRTLRTGQGHLAVVRWVREQLHESGWQFQPGDDLAHLAGSLARRLTTRILERLAPRIGEVRARETVVGE